MFDIDKVRSIIAERNATDDEWDDRLEQCWDQLAEELSKDPQQTAKFVMQCSDEELSTISEVLDELIWRTQSPDIIKAYRTAVQLHSEENKRFHLGRMLDTAIDTMLKDRFQASQLMVWRPTEEAIERLRR